VKKEKTTHKGKPARGKDIRAPEREETKRWLQKGDGT